MGVVLMSAVTVLKFNCKEFSYRSKIDIQTVKLLCKVDVNNGTLIRKTFLLHFSGAKFVVFIANVCGAYVSGGLLWICYSHMRLLQGEHNDHENLRS